MPRGKRLFSVQSARKRVPSLTPEQRRMIVFLFDQTQGDYDAVADRCGIIGVQRGDVLAVVLAEMRKQPERAPALRIASAGRVA